MAYAAAVTRWLTGNTQRLGSTRLLPSPLLLQLLPFPDTSVISIQHDIQPHRLDLSLKMMEITQAGFVVHIAGF